ncbi:hypothetical protein [Streptomyces sp. NPDC050145]|uniref:hypothetical protein n=1 Tax=Streptomyces sp. NPDC050145 TaxID=3365602 RepID=UPI003795B64F
MRVRINYEFINGLVHDAQVAQVVQDVARDVDAACASDSRVDWTDGLGRFRAAVIAGYEPGATAESTRRALLQALSAGGGNG